MEKDVETMTKEELKEEFKKIKFYIDVNFWFLWIIFIVIVLIVSNLFSLPH